MLNNEFPPLGGGTGTVNLEIFNQFSNKEDFSIDLITSGNSSDPNLIQFSDNIRIIKLKVNSKNIHHASNFELIKYTFKATLKAIILHRKEKYDVSFAWSTVPSGFVSFILKLLFGLKYIVRIGGPDIPGFEERYKIIYKIISPLIKLIWKKSELLITKCASEYEMVKKIKSEVTIKIIFNGVDIDKFYPKKKDIQMPLRIICPARLIKRKGQDILINSIAALKKENIIYDLDLIGEGDEKENFIKLAKEKKVKENINFIGYVPRKKMSEYYQKADIFVLASYNEGMSNALLEAMACGLPVVVTNVGGTKELVEEGGNGYIFNVGDEKKLREILKNIYYNRDKLNIFGRYSRLKAENLSWGKIAAVYKNLFDEIRL